MDTWAWRHGHGWISDGMHMHMHIHMHMRMQLHTCTACTLSMCKCTGTDCCTRMGHTHGMSRRSRPSTRESPARTHWCSESAACGPGPGLRPLTNAEVGAAPSKRQADAAIATHLDLWADAHGTRTQKGRDYTHKRGQPLCGVHLGLANSLALHQALVCSEPRDCSYEAAGVAI